VIQHAFETAALMLGTHKSRGWMLEIICADFLAGANLESGNPRDLMPSIEQRFGLFPRLEFSKSERNFVTFHTLRRSRLRPGVPLCVELHGRIPERDGWRCQSCGFMTNLQVHHIQSRSGPGDDREENLIRLCTSCHKRIHLRISD
jgi:hypothetical protein